MSGTVDKKADDASFANLKEVQVESYHLELKVDFAAKSLGGYIDMVTVGLTDAKSVVLDTRELTIQKVENTKGEKIDFTLPEKPHPVFGSKLTVNVALKKGEKKAFRIYYVTAPTSSAIQWLPPSNTAGKKHPYLFTQCQAIHARSMIPCMDSPGVKSRYTARVEVPSALTALMSAKSLTKEAKKSPSGTTAFYEFKQDVPTPSYLVALVVGNLKEKVIGPRSSVWSEPEMVDAGAYEFALTEEYLKKGEEIAGPYVWGRYDILLLPPSFPYGGMENPCLTFVTPTLLAGDRSLATVVIHEISHSWMGNLVTCETWKDFWMNEGFCRMLELKIIKALFGAKHFDLHACIGLKALRESIKMYGDEHNFTKMRPELEGVDPDDAFSSVPYEKGLNFLIYLENLIGGEKVMNPLLKSYCEKFKFSTITAEEFKEFFIATCTEAKVDKKVLDSIEWEKWWTTPGMPYKANKFDRSMIDVAVKAAADASNGGSVDGKMMEKWSTHEMVVFLDALEDIEVKRIEEAKKADKFEEFTEKFQKILIGLEKTFPFSKSRNSEIRFRWYKVGIRAEWEPVFEAAKGLATEQGRMKFVRPLYRLLFASKLGKKMAVETFQAKRQVYHSIAAKMVAKDLGLAK
uniref:Peptidase M1 leukotriene A4 hydrolase/aminopeptidase C-terminal domain-containing protein n=1 Tax=Lotharella oceanica TaxID=641309 RepID=A0A7S2TWP0_9EUKA|mmetsp:Transcript_30973/g.57793  ORF Transcript_30973/g.57793 Transcript_30973/m.57793 type:complete len:631 (+) Transcript_30973:39-1931(+)